MNRKLFVGNFPYTTTSADLRDAFSQAGTVEKAAVISDKETGRARGFGFVTMATEEDARAAIQRFDGADFGGRPIVVSPAKADTNKPAHGGRRGDHEGGHRHRDRQDHRRGREARW